MKELISVNGKIVGPEEAVITVFDRGLLYGDGVYEVTRTYDRVLFALEDHLDRLFLSAERIGLEIGYTKEGLENELYRVCNTTELDNIYMRIVITRGDGRINLDPTVPLKPN